MSTRNWAIVAAVSLGGVLVWFFWDTIKAIFFGGTIISESVVEDDMENVEVKGSEAKRMALLLPQVQRALQDTINDCASQGLKLFIGQTLRTEEQQSVNVSKGTSATIKSWHRIGRAADVYVVDPNTGDVDFNGKRTDLYLQMHRTAEKNGFENIAFWSDDSKRFITTSKGKIWDGGHMQMTEGKSWDEAAEEYGVA